ncbi:hypothetical protein LCGC14_0477860 [marine sediment metagenome]|uniref:Uncharacterized protein n=1 Tax=marine sediment metagenome TaxID=412755 RepID=A0A0F9SAD9_9ZZZZ
MTKSKEQLIANCTNKHDRKLIIKDLEKHEKIMNKSHTLTLIAAFFTFIGFAGLLFNDYFILSFIPVFPLMGIVLFYNLKESGIV